MKKAVAIGIAVFLVCLILMPSVSATWCNNDYGKKAPILINNTGGSAQTYYQVDLNYTHDSDMNSNFSDIQVYNESDCSLVPLWNESAVASSWNKIWFNVTNIPASSWTNDTYYLYYNYSSATAASNITTTFLFGDDFEDDFDNDMTEQISTSSYDAFGLLVKNSDTTVINFFRQGTSHAGDKGKLVRQSYNLTTKSWDTRYDVYEDATYDIRGFGGGIIGSHIFIFLAQYNYSTATWVDMGFIKSTDLTGTSWGSYTTIDISPLTAFCSYGHIVATNDTNTFLQPFYGYEGSNASVKLFKTTDSGDNWAVGSTIYSGTTQWSETCVAYINNSKMIALLRNDDGGYVGQATSADNGTSWTAVSNTNLGAATSSKVPYIIYDSENTDVIAVYFDKASPYSIKISKTDAATVYASASSWTSPTTLDTWSIPRNGYPSIVKTATGAYFLVYAKEISASDSDIWGGHYPLNYPDWDKWDVVGTPTIVVSDSIMTMTCDVEEYIESKSFTQSPPAILEVKSKDKDYGTKNYPAAYGFGHYHGITYDTYGVGRHAYTTAQYMLVVNNNFGRDITDGIARNTNFAKYKIEWTTAICHIYEDDVKKDSDDITTYIPTGSLKTVIGRTYFGLEGGTFDIDWIFVRKYTSTEPTAQLGDEEDAPAVSNVLNGSVSFSSHWVDWDVDQSCSNRWKYSLYENMSSESWSNWDNATAAPNITVTGLSGSTTYYFQAWAYNTSDNSLTDNSSATSFTTPVAATTPSVSNVVNGSVSFSSHWVDWDVDQVCANRWRYSLYENMSSESWSNWDNDTAAPNITVTGLSASTTYYFQAWSYNTSDNSLTDNSSATSFTTPAISGTTPSISNVTTSSINSTAQWVSWVVNQSCSNRVKYALYENMSSSSWSNWDNATATPNITVSNLSTVKYYYQAWSYNTTDESLTDNSTTANFTADATAPTITEMALSPASVLVGDPVTITCTVVDGGVGVKNVSFEIMDAKDRVFNYSLVAGANNSYAYEFTYTGKEGGYYIQYFRAYDENDNLKEESSTLSFSAIGYSAGGNGGGGAGGEVPTPSPTPDVNATVTPSPTPPPMEWVLQPTKLNGENAIMGMGIIVGVVFILLCIGILWNIDKEERKDNRGGRGW